MIKVADFVIQYLADCGISDIFVVYGAANGDLIDAFTRTEKTRYVAVMHEQAGGFAAEGYAKISGKFGVAIATSGPGGQNFVTPIGNCFYDSVPCLFITGQINSKFLRPDPEIRQIGFQETDICGIVRPITKYASMLRSPEDVKFELEKALYLMKEGRPGPVLLDIPLDIQKAKVDPDKLIGFNPKLRQVGFDDKDIEEKIETYIKDLKAAKRPCLMIGGGVMLGNAVEEFRELGELLKIPAFPTWNALDIVTSDYPYYGGRIGTYGGAGRNFGIQNTDLLLAIGSRISGRITGGNVKSFARAAKKYVVDVDSVALQPKLQQVPFDVCVLSDAKQFMRRLIDRLKQGNTLKSLPDFSAWTQKVIGWRKQYDPVLPEYMKPADIANPYAFARVLSEVLRPADIVVPDCGGNVVVMSHAFETKHKQRFFSNHGNSPMGFSFAGALGACFAAKKGQHVVCVIGDGGFNMNLQELQTLVNYRIPLKTFIMNNHIYGITKAFQETNFEGRAEACGPKGYNPPNFVKICQAYGVKTVLIEGNDLKNMRTKIEEVLAAQEPVVCDVNCHEWHTYEPKIVGWETPIEDMYPYIDREEFLKNMAIEPLPTYKNPVYPSIHKAVKTIE
ncbi:MAG: thiamine pyrophosphate-binding protein [Oligoflexia bacterium]|nr:thiamine pyrophosphate-binding protein [Oligoflexia bacterium]